MTVQTPLGAVRGTQHRGVHAFLGLRYAEPPVRFRASLPVAAWTGEYDATSQRERAIQAEAFLPELGGSGVTSEDCLFLNVYTPGTDPAGRPVLVWIHGGGLIAGSANDFDASVLAAQGDVVVVTISYRLGFFGFLDMSRFGPEYAGSASNGFRDQITALTWVRDCIASFGGDPHNVTIFGESGGAGCVRALLAAPSADGLYHRAAAFSPGGPVSPPIDFATRLGVRLDVREDMLLDALVALPAADLLALQDEIVYLAGAIDGTVLTRPTPQAVRERGTEGVPILAGTVRDEGTVLVTAIEEALPGTDVTLDLPHLQRAATILMRGEDPAGYVEGLRATYPDSSERDLSLHVLGDVFRRQSTEIAEAASEAGPGGWLYRFDIESPIRDGALGAAHGVEIPFIFNDFDTTPYELSRQDTSDPRILELARAWSDAVLAFARTGDPNHDGLPTWPRYAESSRDCLVFDREPHVESDPGPDAAHRALWESLVPAP